MVDYKNLYHLGFWLPATNRYESDFSNEVLYMPVDQEAAKLSKVKIGGQKICQFSQAQPCQCEIWLTRQLWLLVIYSFYKKLKYLIWKIWFISVWSGKPNALAWILMCLILIQTTPFHIITRIFLKAVKTIEMFEKAYLYFFLGMYHIGGCTFTIAWWCMSKPFSWHAIRYNRGPTPCYWNSTRNYQTGLNSTNSVVC